MVTFLWLQCPTAIAEVSIWTVRAKQRSQQESSRAEQKVPHTCYGLSALHSLPGGEASKGVVGTVTTVGEVYSPFSSSIPLVQLLPIP